ncbi:hypothetical protein ABIE91_003025 [Bradyrhizobium elkanii]|jgi:hypothetical protein
MEVSEAKRLKTLEDENTAEAVAGRRHGLHVWSTPSMHGVVTSSVTISVA